MKKYKILYDTKDEFNGITIYRIMALRDFGDVEAGDIGGYIEKEENLSHDGECWIYNRAKVFNNALISGNAKIRDDAIICDNAIVSDNAKVSCRAVISNYARIYGSAYICNKATARERCIIKDNVIITCNADIYGYTTVSGNANIGCYADISSNKDYAVVQGFGSAYRVATFYMTKDKEIIVRTGCFCDTIDVFRRRVKQKHKYSKTAKEYNMIADLMEFKFTNKKPKTSQCSK